MKDEEVMNKIDTTSTDTVKNPAIHDPIGNYIDQKPETKRNQYEGPKMRTSLWNASQEKRYAGKWTE